MSKIVLRPFTDADLSSVAALKNRHVKGSGDRWEKRFHWQYRENPAFQGEDFVGWALVADDAVRGAAFVMRQRFRCEAEEVTVPILADMIVAPELSIQCLQLMKAYFELAGSGPALCTSAAEATSRMWKAFGGDHLAGTDCQLSAVLRPGAILKDKLAQRIGLSLPRVIFGPVDGFWQLTSRKTLSPGYQLKHELVAASDHRLQDVVAETASLYTFTAARDTQYLKWRYERSGARIVLVSARSGEPVCWAAYTDVPSPGSARRARVLDISGAVTDSEASAVASTVLRHLCEMRYDAAVLVGMHSSWRTAFKNVGCRVHSRPSSFVVKSENMETSGWHVVPADGDNSFWDLDLTFSQTD